MTLSHRRLSTMLALTLSTAIIAVTFGVVAGGQSPAVREGTCELAEELFPNHNPGPGSLKRMPVPEPTNLGVYLRNRNVAIALGKAFFWDMQVGTDGVQACASCHFRAGADPRSINQLNPGGADNSDPSIDLGGPNYQLKASDFPFHKLADPTDRHSTVIQDIDDVTSSQGVHFRQFVGVEPGATRDIATPIPDPVFNIDGINTRRAEPRNTPTMINAAFNHNNFWDRRARNIFNGFSVQGAGDSAARVLRATGPDHIDRVIVRIDNASLASQAVGPPLSDREMGSVGRTFKDIGKRLGPAEPLRQQEVSPSDSVLGRYANVNDRRGLRTTYRELIETAFAPAWWRSNLIVSVAGDGSLVFVPQPDRPLHDNEYTMLEFNFSLFFGLSVQLYEMTLISDDAPVDRFFDGDRHALTDQELRGMAVFTGDSACAGCHVGAEFTDNSTRILFGTVVDGVKQPAELVERMFNGQCEVVAYDQGIYNIGVRRTEEDLGHGNNDPFGNPLSFVKLLTLPPNEIPSQELLSFPVPDIANPPIAIGERTVTDGTFKVPSLRNLELTAPYFHNGGQRTIRQVVEFYNRGGDFREHNVLNIDFEIGKLNLTSEQIDDLVAFLGRPLTDPRVLQQRAPFDHPQLFVPNGHFMQRTHPGVTREGVAQDVFLEIPAVGRRGGPPPAAFLQFH
jgi:cytochrome c peroxidase